MCRLTESRDENEYLPSSSRSTSAREVKRVLSPLYSASVLRSRAQSSPCNDMATGSCIVISATIYAERSGSVGVINFVLSSVMGALMVETPQSVPTAPSMHRHTMRVVLVIGCKFRFFMGTYTGMPVQVQYRMLFTRSNDRNIRYDCP